MSVSSVSSVFRLHQITSVYVGGTGHGARQYGASRGFKKIFGGGGGGLNVNIVSVHILYIGFTSVLCLFMSDRTGFQVLQFTSDYVRLRLWTGTWSSTTGTKQGQDI